MTNSYFYTFGYDPGFPFRNGWVEVRAESWQQAHQKFRARYPDRTPGVLNCAFFYTEKSWRQMAPEQNWHGYRSYGIIE